MYPYQNYYGGYAPYQSQIQPQQLQFVNGIESAQAYQMPPNSKQILMDANRARFYLVATDAAGVKSVESYDFAKAEAPAPPDMSQYVTRAEFDEWRANHEPVKSKRTAKPAETNDANV